jgi:hypothetical protein
MVRIAARLRLKSRWHGAMRDVPSTYTGKEVIRGMNSSWTREVAAG